jgi:hypothetical protein
MNQTFTATIVKLGTRMVIVLPFDPNAVWGSRQRFHITGTVNGYPVRGPLASEGGQVVLALGPAWLRGSGLEAGARVEVTLSPEGPQADHAPDIAAALEAEPGARAFFEALPSFYRKNYIRWIESAKRPETRKLRIIEMVELLKAGVRQK